MSTPEYLSLFSLEGEFSVETPGVPVALRRVSGGALADLMKSPPCALSFDEYRHEVLRYEVDPANKVLRIHVRQPSNAVDRNRVLYDRYLELVRSEMDEFGVKPTAITHLMGRLGELHCAVEVCGKLADLTNQPGFDVESPSGKRISVKTTAQVSGFVSISANTLQKADELMLVQYLNGQTKTVFHGSVQKAVTGTRMWEGRYELDIGRARKLSALPD